MNTFYWYEFFLLFQNVILENKLQILTNETQFNICRYLKFNNEKNAKHLVQISLPKTKPYIFFLMLLSCDNHIRQQHSIDVFRPTVIGPGNKWKDWTCMCWPAYNSSTTNRLWYSELHCTGILQRTFGGSARITTLHINTIFPAAISINQWLTLTFVTSLELMIIVLGSRYL